MNIFNKRKTVLYITNNTLEGGNVIFSKEPILTDYTSITWSDDGLNNSLKLLSTKVRAKKVILTLGEGFISIVNITLPNNLQLTEEREYILQEIKKVSPDTAESGNWKFKTIAYHTDKKEVLAYSPIIEKFQMLTSALQSIRCAVECIEPDIIAKARHQNALIGAAIEAKDEKTGTNEPLIHLTKNVALDIQKVNKISNKWVAISFVVLMLGIGMWIITQNTNSNESTNESQEVPVEVMKTNETTESTGTPAKIQKEMFNPENYSIQILNGTGIEGLAAKTSGEFKNIGFADIEIGNAASADVLITQIYFKAEPDITELKIIVLDTLGLHEGNIQNKSEENGEFDVKIVLGQDFVNVK